MITTYQPNGPMWVFGYGSLMWQPDFPVAERQIARAQGWSRSFCMWSIHHRGTVRDPGLVLALDESAPSHCDGVALRVAPGAEAETLAMLRERELVSSAYLETTLPVAFRDGTLVQSLAYVMDKQHVQYTGPLSLEAQARVIATARGGRGPNYDYLWSTVSQLHQMGIADPDLDWLAARVRQLVESA